MGGGLMQLVAYGAQDIYLTGNPQITFFKVVYRRHTNFSMELVQQTFEGTVEASSRVSVTISRNGDLVHDIYYKINKGTKIDKTSGWNPGYNIINNIECEIGGQLIDRNYGHWLEVWAELTESQNYVVSPPGVAATPLLCSRFQAMALAGNVADTDSASPITTTGSHWVPLQFWFCRNPGNSLPLIALQYHEVRIVTNFSAALSAGAGNINENISMWANYIYLDTDERRRFAQVSHEYLIEQVQYHDDPGDTGDIKLNFNHPVKELIWAGKQSKEWGSVSVDSGSFDDVKGGEWQLRLNGHDRFAAQDKGYFTRQQIWKYHTGSGSRSGVGKSDSGIAVYSFALKPEEHQPSGTCNFSRIDSAELLFNVNDTNQYGYYIYAVNYNVLRIMSGMGGLAYSN